MNKVLLFFISLIIFTSCSQCTTDVESIQVVYDNIDDMTFRSIPPKDFDRYVENNGDQKTTVITDKCEILNIIDEFDQIMQNDTMSLGVDTRMRFTIKHKDKTDRVYMGITTIMIREKSYWLSNESLKKILKYVDEDQLKRIGL